MSKRTFRITFEMQFERNLDEEADPIDDPKKYIEARVDALAEDLNNGLESYDFYVTFDKLEEMK